MNQSSNSKTSQTPSALARIWSGLKAYLTDWRNLLGHALLGVVFVVVAVWAPITLWLKLVIIAVLITFNVLRMRLKNKNTQAKEGAAE